MNSKTPLTLREQVLAKIESDEVQMHSRLFFALKVACVVIVAAAVLLISVFIGNLVFFTLRINGHDELLSLGGHGIVLFARVFPWWLLVLDGVLVVGLVWLIRQFHFGYRRPTLYIFLGLVILALVAGFALDHGTPLNDQLLKHADRGELPSPLRSVYKGARHSPPQGDAFRGTVTSIGETSFTMRDPDVAQELIVLFPLQGMGAHPQLSVGDNVFVVGTEVNSTIQALDIHPLDPNGLPPEEGHENGHR